MLGYSAARLTQRVPWLCVPLSREVCLFVCPTDDNGMRMPGAISANFRKCRLSNRIATHRRRDIARSLRSTAGGRLDCARINWPKWGSFRTNFTQSPSHPLLARCCTPFRLRRSNELATTEPRRAGRSPPTARPSPGKIPERRIIVRTVGSRDVMATLRPCSGA